MGHGHQNYFWAKDNIVLKCPSSSRNEILQETEAPNGGQDARLAPHGVRLDAGDDVAVAMGTEDADGNGAVKRLRGQLRTSDRQRRLTI